MSLTIYCCYHDARIQHFEHLRWINPQADNVTYVKVLDHPYTFPCKRHIELRKQPWFKNIGTKWQEWEFINSLYLAARDGLVELPEHVGFAHYDMNLRAYRPYGQQWTDETMTVMTSYTVDWAVKQGIKANGREVVQQLLEMSGLKYDQKTAMRLLPLCSAAIVPRWAFMESMKRVSAEMADPQSILQASGQNERFAGSLSERLYAVQLLARDLITYHCPIEHLLVQSDKVALPPY